MTQYKYNTTINFTRLSHMLHISKPLNNYDNTKMLLLIVPSTPNPSKGKEKPILSIWKQFQFIIAAGKEDSQQNGSATWRKTASKNTVAKLSVNKTLSEVRQQPYS